MILASSTSTATSCFGPNSSSAKQKWMQFWSKSRLLVTWWQLLLCRRIFLTLMTNLSSKLPCQGKPNFWQPEIPSISQKINARELRSGRQLNSLSIIARRYELDRPFARGKPWAFAIPPSLSLHSARSPEPIRCHNNPGYILSSPSSAAEGCSGWRPCMVVLNGAEHTGALCAWARVEREPVKSN